MMTIDLCYIVPVLWKQYNAKMIRVYYLVIWRFLSKRGATIIRIGEDVIHIEDMVAKTNSANFKEAEYVRCHG